MLRQEKIAFDDEKKNLNFMRPIHEHIYIESVR
jgi:hypothetical protein